MKVHWKKVPIEYLKCVAHNHNLGVRFYLENEGEIDWWKTEGVAFFRRKELQVWARRMAR